MKKYKAIIVAILTMCCVATGCANTLKSISKDVKKSMESVTAITCVYTMRDGNEIVYKYTEITQISGATASIERIESKLNDYFVLEDQSTFETVSVNRNKLCVINFDEKLFKSYEIKDGVLNCVIAADKAEAVLGSNPDTDSDVELSAVFENNKLMSISYELQSKSNKAVSVIMEYEYDVE